MKQKFTFKTFIALLLLSGLAYNAAGQNNVYWRESFSLSSSQGDLGANSIPYDYTGDAGVWTFYGVYTTTGTGCEGNPPVVGSNNINNHIRSTNNTGLGSGTTGTLEDDTAYAITPVVNNGVQEIHFIRSRNNRRITIWKTPDESSTTLNWILVTTVPKSTSSPVALCTDTTIVVNDLNAKRIRFRFERTQNNDIDSVYLTSVTALPVNFVSARAFAKNGGIQVEWTSATESNLSRYAVEKSSDGRTFREVGSVAPGANGTSARTYSWIDATPTSTSNFYRIKAIDRDGGAKYTSIMKVSLGRGVTSLLVSPNPVAGNVLSLQLNNFERGTYNLQLINGAGQKVFAGQIVHQGGSASETMQIPTLPKGLYNLQVIGTASRISKSVVVD